MMLARRMPAGVVAHGSEGDDRAGERAEPGGRADAPGDGDEPRRRPAPACSPASPSTRISPPRMPARDPA